MLPLLGALGGSYLGTAGALGGLGALGGAALGSGLGGFLQTGSLQQGLATGIGSYFTGGIYGSMAGSAFPNASFAGMNAGQLGQALGAGLGGMAMIPQEIERRASRDLKGRSYANQLNPLSLRLLKKRQEDEEEQLPFPNIKGFREGGLNSLTMPQQLNDKQLIQMVRSAVEGSIDRETSLRVLGEFVNRFGKEKLARLLKDIAQKRRSKTKRPSEGMIDGFGDGMDDFVPASNESNEDILLSNEEYILPADFVSAVGNGSSEEGGEVLDEMVANVRIAKNGKPEQPPRIDPSEYLIG
jgi:hypothetical protein|tara:strand:- start:634 stop:1527 length:894 start_codon:yes stop_codon:yes gene_type:complete